MKNKSEEAVAMMVEGFNCAQSVLSVFCEDFHLDRPTALKLATGFGAGMANQQEICGAVTGAIMAIGLKHGRSHASDLEAKEQTYFLTRELMASFKAKFGSCYCRELLPGIDLATAAGHALYKEKNLAEKVCRPCVAEAVRILENILAQPRRSDLRYNE
ncbi:MAG: C-GCAxxG-C-C family protein [Candidatus Aminicenantes bacterium]|nr:C-GCAxxG-C-C family protein [Candidatus Aminicenantes bacterium]